MKQLSLWSTDEATSSNVVKKPQKWQLFIDGAARNNPGPAGIGMLLKRNDEIIFEKGFYIGHHTNNRAEYMALLVGLFFTKEHVEKGDTLEIYSDSKLLINQMKRIFQVRDVQLQKLHTLATQLIEAYMHDFFHIYREYNTHADRLANLGIDKKILLPEELREIFIGFE